MPENKCIFITGAASGIGRATALLFADRGWFVGAADLDETGLETLKAEIESGRCETYSMNTADPESVRMAMESFAQNTGGKMDALFNNAGIVTFGRFDDIGLEEKNRVIDVNLKGVMNCAHLALPYLKAVKGSRLINMASTSAIYGVPDLSPYSASKHAVKAITEALNIELAPDGVVVCDILAPYVRTPLLNTPKEVRSIKAMGVHFEPEDIAEVVWKAVHKKKLHWWVGGTTYLLLFVFWLAPFLRRGLVKFLTIESKRS